MENIFYNILWIDDEHETLGGTKGRAKRNGINLIPFKSLNGGMSELSRNYPFYDGVLLDAKFFENEDDTKGSEDTFNVHRAKEQLLQLKKKFEIFVLTGQAEAYDDKTFKKAFTNVYKKGSDEEIDRLFNDVKEAGSRQEDTQLRHNYKRVFDVCTERYIGEYAGQDILNLLKLEEASNIDDYFNSIRKVVEDIFSAFHKFNLLPSEFVYPNIALNQTSIFLSGKEQHERTENRFKQHRHLEGTYFPVQISNCLKNILTVTQPGSHRSNVDDHIRSLRTPFLLKSVFYQLLDVIIWFKLYVDSNPPTNNWEVIEISNGSQSNPSLNIVKGKVIQLNREKGYAFLHPIEGTENIFIPPHLVSNHNLKENEAITGEMEEYEDNRTGEAKKRIKNIVNKD